MDEIEFVIAEDQLGGGPMIAIEPVINGVSLVEIVMDTTGSRYGGMYHEHVLERLTSLGARYSGQILGCGCGDDRCSWVATRQEVSESEVIWSNVRSDSDREAAALAALGPYRFDRATFERSLSHPTPREAPVRSSEWSEPA
jgi:hypothetical protein